MKAEFKRNGGIEINAETLTESVAIARLLEKGFKMGFTYNALGLKPSDPKTATECRLGSYSSIQLDPSDK